MAKPKSNMSPAVQEAISDQINAEFSASYAYLAMSAYCERQNFMGCARWLRIQSQEEYAHGLKLFDFLLARNCEVSLRALPDPALDFESVVQVFEKALDQEHDVSRRIDSLYELAFREKAFAALVELQWFISEQVEEEKTLREVVAKFHMVGDDAASLLDLDRELGSRVPDPPPPAAV